MNYSETLDWLFSRLPMYQRIGGAAYKVDLTNTHILMEMLEHPENTFKSIHIAGTNGKGSVSHLLAAAFQKAGYKTGLYTSPHLVDFRERIRIDGEMVSEQYVVDFIETYREKIESYELSFFELTVGMCFDYFRSEKVDIAIIETGMGGRLDSTNVVNPEISAITQIGFDHMKFLGDTLEKIAGEKAGIIKRNTPVVIGRRQSETTSVYKAKSTELSAPIHWAEEMQIPMRKTDLIGEFQRENVRTAGAVIAVARELGWKLPEEAVQNGFERVQSTTGLRGRWEKLNDTPLAIADSGHNADGIKAVLHELEKTPFEKLHWILGMVNDKDVDQILKMLPRDAEYYFTQAKIPRAMPAVELAEKAQKHGLTGTVIPDVRNAYETALSAARKEDVVFVGGSFFVVAEVL
jgi:dihydrofolate synthase/folylpolyglutamate synthase